MTSPAAILVRWVARATGVDVVQYLLPQWTVLFLLVVELDVIVDFRDLARRASALAPVWAALALASACGVASAVHRRFVADAWLGPRHAVLRRQPVTGTAWGPASVVVLGPLAAPVGVCALFWYGGTAWPAAVTWTGLALLPLVFAGGRRFGAAAVACGVAGGVAAIGQAWPGSYVGWAIAVWAVAVPLTGVVSMGLASWSSGAIRPFPRRPRSVLGALVHRDGLTVWRRDGRIVGLAALAAAPIGAVVGAMRVNGEYPGPSLATGALVGLALVGPLALQTARAVARNLGGRFDPPEWPVTAGQRVLSLALVAGGTLVPGWAAAAVVGPPIGVAGHLRIATFIGSLGAGAAWWVVSRPGHPNLGTWPYWIALCLAPVLVPWGAPAGGVLAAIAFGLASRGLEQRRRRP